MSLITLLLGMWQEKLLIGILWWRRCRLEGHLLQGRPWVNSKLMRRQKGIVIRFLISKNRYTRLPMQGSKFRWMTSSSRNLTPSINSFQGCRAVFPILFSERQKSWNKRVWSLHLDKFRHLDNKKTHIRLLKRWKLRKRTLKMMILMIKIKIVNNCLNKDLQKRIEPHSALQINAPSKVKWHQG